MLTIAARRLSRLVLLASASLVAIAAWQAPAAHALTYCVSKPACVTAGGTMQVDLQSALNTAAGTPAADRIELGPVTMSRVTGYTYTASSEVDIVGTATPTAWYIGATRLTNSSPDPSDEFVFRLSGNPNSSISNVAILLPSGTGNDNRGLDLSDGTADQIHVEARYGSAESPDAVWLNNGTISNSIINAAPDFSVGVRFNGGSSNRVVASEISADLGAVLAAEGTSGRVERASLQGDSFGVRGDAGTSVVVVNTLIRRIGSSAYTPTAALLFTDVAGANSSMEVVNSTIVGNGDSKPAALVRNSQNRIISLTLRNTIVTGFTTSIDRVTGPSSVVNVTTVNSAYIPFTSSGTGTGTVSETSRIEPAGLDADYHPTAASPLIDAGTDVGVPSVDLAGNARTVDGNGDCTARTDIGAFEFLSGPRAPKAAAASVARAVVKKAVAFNSAGSCDPDGDALTYSWNFGDGTSAAGAAVQHAFKTPGRYTVDVTVTDATGRSTSAVTRVTVVPKFTGATVVTSKVTQKAGVVKLVVKCPPTALGACSGTVTLPGLGAAKFTAAIGGTKVVPVKLTKAGLALLKARGSIALPATVVAGDTSGVKAKTKRTVLVRR